MSRPRASERAERVEGGYLLNGQFYSEREWQQAERRRERWRLHKARLRADPQVVQQQRERVSRYIRTDRGREYRRRFYRRQQERINQEWLAECQRKYGALSDDDIRLLILNHEVDLRQMRSVLRVRAIDRRIEQGEVA